MATLNIVRLPRWAARLVLMLAAALIAYGVAASLAAPPAAAPHATGSMSHDADLYRAVADRVARGEGYYAAAAAEQRARDYPLKPFVTVRPPLLAEATALAGGPATMAIMLDLLVLATLIALVVRTRDAVADRRTRLAAITLAALALFTLAQPDLAVWHEAWAALLVALALAIHRPARWWPGVIAALLAALVRELAIPFLIVMGCWAIVERRRAEAMAWAAALAIAAAALAVHAAQVAAVVSAADATSPGWTGAGGWPFVVSMLARTSLFALLPLPVAAALVPLALIGWVGLDHPFARRATLWIVGMMSAFMLFGRPDNFYWGMMLAPLLPIGLAFAPAALVNLARAAR